VLLVLRYQLGDQPEKSSEQDIADAVTLVAEGHKAGNVAFIFFGRAPTPGELNAAQRSGHVRKEDVYCLSTKLGAERAYQRMSDAIAHLRATQITRLIDCHTFSVETRRTDIAKIEGESFGSLFTRLNDAHAEQNFGLCLRICNQLYALTALDNNGVISEFREKLKSLITVIGLIDTLLSGLVVEGSSWQLPKRFGLPTTSLLPRREHHLLTAIAKNFSRVDPGISFLGIYVSFFNVLLRCEGAFSSRGDEQMKSAVEVWLSWLSVYSLAASKRALAAGEFHVSLLFSVRAAEFFALARLWQGEILTLQGSRFLLDGVGLEGLRQVWQAFSERLDLDLGALAQELDILREVRNQSFLIHGLESPHKQVALRARQVAKALLLKYDGVGSQRLIVGPLEDIAVGERWSGELGDWLAQYLLGLVRAE
jgi:hypothetical protein